MSDTHGMGRGENMNGCCNGSMNTGRGFLTIQEKVEMLKEYKEQLDLESKGVAEQIERLQKAGAA